MARNVDLNIYDAVYPEHETETDFYRKSPRNDNIKKTHVALKCTKSA